MLDHIDRQDWTSPAASWETHEFLTAAARTAAVEAVFLVDPNGILASNRHSMPRRRARPEYFAAAKAQSSDAIVITPPFPGTNCGTTGFMISRRRARDGQFDGMVGVTVSHQYFETFYRAILDNPTASAAGLVRTDGALLVRFPDPPGRPVALPASNPMLVEARRNRLSGVRRPVESGRQSAHRRSIAAFRRLRDLPLLVRYSIIGRSS
jgi:hypothetical protein